MENKFTQSRAQRTTDITKALRKVLWGVSWLGKLDKCATSTLTVIKEAMELLDDRLSKVRHYPLPLRFILRPSMPNQKPASRPHTDRTDISDECIGMKR